MNMNMNIDGNGDDPRSNRTTYLDLRTALRSIPEVYVPKIFAEELVNKSPLEACVWDEMRDRARM